METEPKDPQLERAQNRVSSLRERLQEHRERPLTTQAWTAKEQSLLDELAAAEGGLANRTAERGIVDA